MSNAIEGVCKIDKSNYLIEVAITCKNIDEFNENHTILDNPNSKIIGLFRNNILLSDFNPGKWEINDRVYLITSTLSQCWAKAKKTSFFG